MAGSGGLGGATAATSATSGGGGCGPGADTDADGLTDCAEIGDGDPWTDPAVFNGMHVQLADECSGSPACADNDTLAEVTACMATAVLEEQDQSSGWSFIDQPDDVCSPGYGFAPAWTSCTNTWQALWQGFIDLKQPGYHCFAIAGGLDEQCAALFFDAETTAVQTNGAPGCFDVAAGVYPIRWHYTMDNGTADKYSMQVQYCAGGAAPCTPASVIENAMLRPVYP